jgi:hypothetical protein
MAGRHMPRRKSIDAEDAVMKAIWAIIWGLGAMLILSIAMVFVTMPRRSIPHKTIPPPCRCSCMRKAGVP